MRQKFNGVYLTQFYVDDNLYHVARGPRATHFLASVMFVWFCIVPLNELLKAILLLYIHCLFIENICYLFDLIMESLC